MVKVITDSPSDIPAAVARELGLTVVPVNITFGTESFRDSVDLTTEQFYEKLERSKAVPTTAIPSISTIVGILDKLAEETNEILVVTLSRKFGAFNEVARQARELMRRKCRVEVIDSQAGAMAEGLVVIAAAKAAKAGANLDELVRLTRRNIPRTEIRMAFDTLEYLKRGGRIGRARALLGSVLRVNPILGIKDGEAYPYARERSRGRAINYLYNFVVGFSRIEEMAIEDATTPHEADKLAERLSAKFPKERIYRSKVSPVVGAHVGPHVLAVAVLGDR